MTTKPAIFYSSQNFNQLRKDYIRTSVTTKNVSCVFKNLVTTCFGQNTPRTGNTEYHPKKQPLRRNSALPVDGLFRPKQFATKFLYTFYKKKALFISKSDLFLGKKLVKCYIWTIAFYSAKT